MPNRETQETRPRFGRQCLQNMGIGQIELTAEPQGTGSHTTDPCPGKFLGERLEECFPIPCPVGSALFVLADVAADGPVPQSDGLLSFKVIPRSGAPASGIE